MLTYDDFIIEYHDGEDMNQPYYCFIGNAFIIHIDPVEFRNLSALEVSLFDPQHNLVYSRQTPMKRWSTFDKAFTEARGIAEELINQYEQNQQAGLRQFTTSVSNRIGDDE